MSQELKLRIDQCLSLIPADYYAIANIEDLKSQLEKTETLLVDVRETSEYQLGYIPNAINIPFRTLVSNVEQIPRDRPVVLYCSTGYRAAMGVLTLHLLSYENIQGFPPGFVAWKNAEEAIAH